MTYIEFKEKLNQMHNEILDKNDVFWAFGEKQFEEELKKRGLTKKDVESIGAGGWIAKRYQFEKFKKDLEELQKKKQKMFNELSEDTKENAILYELRNYEVFWDFFGTGLDDVIEIFEEYGIGEDEVLKVYKDNRAKYEN